METKIFKPVVFNIPKPMEDIPSLPPMGFYYPYPPYPIRRDSDNVHINIFSNNLINYKKEINRVFDKYSYYEFHHAPQDYCSLLDNNALIENGTIEVKEFNFDELTNADDIVSISQLENNNNEGEPGMSFSFSPTVKNNRELHGWRLCLFQRIEPNSNIDADGIKKPIILSDPIKNSPQDDRVEDVPIVVPIIESEIIEEEALYFLKRLHKEAMGYGDIQPCTFEKFIDWIAFNIINKRKTFRIRRILTQEDYDGVHHYGFEELVQYYAPDIFECTVDVDYL